MKAAKISSVFALVLVFTLGSCNHNDGSDPLEAMPLSFEEQFEVVTYPPEITSSMSIKFKGNLTVALPDHGIKYGFMWYRESEENPVVHNLLVGEGLFTGHYNLIVSDLPRGEDLIVCAFVQSSVNSENTLIGEEVPFSY